MFFSKSVMHINRTIANNNFHQRIIHSSFLIATELATEHITWKFFLLVFMLSTIEMFILCNELLKHQNDFHNSSTDALFFKTKRIRRD